MPNILQEASYAGEGRWDWAVWIDSASEHFDEIESVTWYLHETFPNPLRWVDTPNNGFRLEESSWGSFTLRLTMYNEKGQPAGPHEYKLDLRFPDGTPAADKPTPKVFISGSLTDAGAIRGLTKQLVEQGISVWNLESDLVPGQNWDAAVARAVEDADVFVAMIGGEPSSSVGSEIAIAQSTGKPIVPVVLGASEMPLAIESLNSIQVPLGGDMLPAVTSVLGAIASEE